MVISGSYSPPALLLLLVWMLALARSAATLVCTAGRIPCGSVFMKPPTLLRSSLSMCTSASGPFRGFATGNSDGSGSINLNNLKKDVNRVYQRVFKKVTKASERYQKALSVYNDISAKGDTATLEELESCPNPDPLKSDLSQLQQNLTSLIALEEALKSVKSSSDSSLAALLQQAKELGASDEPAPAKENVEKVPKAPKQKSEPRKPYYVYESFDGITIRVGRGASDNDELSCNPEHRDNDDYWLHVSGYPGSHVVIRYTGDDFIEKYRETLLDACILTAINSKAPQSSKVPVTITRPRFVSKPGGAKPGLVMLRGDVRVVNIDVRAEVAKRMDRLARTTNKPQADASKK